MSDAKKCDRCGAFYDPSDARARIIAVFDKRGVKRLNDHGDTCPECAVAFKTWWNRWRDSMATSPKREVD